MGSRSTRAMWAAKLAGRETVADASLPLTNVNSRPFHGIVAGIDPSLRGSGLAVLRVAGQQMELLESFTLKLKTTYSLPQCLGAIFTAVTELLDRHDVRHVALEQTIYVQNFQTAQILGAARGAAIAAAAVKHLPVFEYPPLRVKQAVAGFGRASKEQVQGQVRGLLKMREELPSDEADASAVGICHALTWREPLAKSASLKS